MQAQQEKREKYDKNESKFIKNRFKVLLLFIVIIFPLSLGIYSLIGTTSYAFISMLFVILATIKL